MIQSQIIFVNKGTTAMNMVIVYISFRFYVVKQMQFRL